MAQPRHDDHVTVDPGFVRTRRGLQCVGASAAAWSTIFAVTTSVGVPSGFRIALFGAGTCLFGALMVTDPRPSDRVRTFGWASVVAAVAVAVTVYLGQVGVWAAAVFLVVQMFLSFALRARSVRAGSLAGIGALTTFVASGGHIATDAIGWFMMASTVGFAWLAVWQCVILPGRPADAAKRAIDVFDRLAADVIACTALATDPSTLGSTSKALRTSLERVISCRRSIDDQLAAFASHGVRDIRIDDLRVTLYSVQAALERLVDHVDRPQWATVVGDDLAASITAILDDLADCARPPHESVALDEVGRRVQQLRHQLGDAEVVAGMTLDAVDLFIESISRTMLLEGASGDAITEENYPAAANGHSRSSGLSPTTALGVQAVVASVSAGLIALWVGIEQSRVVAYTAFLVIAASAGTSLRRAWTRVVATALGATAGVVVAATVPRNPWCIAAVFVVGVFFTVFTAPVSNAAMVFWLSIATVPLAATEGLYLELIRDKTFAALIAGCVTAVVVLVVAPIRLSESLRPAVLTYLDALDAALEGLLPGRSDRDVRAAALDRAHSNFDAIADSAADEIHLLPQPGGSSAEQRVLIDAVHQAFLRVVPVFDNSSTRMLGWTDDDVDRAISHLRRDVAAAKSAVGGDSACNDVAAEPLVDSSIRFAVAPDELHSALAALAVVSSHAVTED